MTTSIRRAISVSEILEERLHRGQIPPGLVAAASLAGHGAFVVFLVLVSRPRPVTFMPTPIRVGIVSPSRLERLAARAPASTAAPTRVEEPVPAARAKPVIEKPVETVVAPSASAMPEPKRGREKPTPPPPGGSRPAARAGSPAVELPSADGSGTPAEKGPGGSFGATVAAFDVDFPFAYYVDQLVSLIGANWLKPAVADGTSCVIAFRVQRSGQVTDVKIETSSGTAFYDRAAERALFAANPLPPLPPEFKSDQLGVHLKFQ